jgi:hypothetical protein
MFQPQRVYATKLCIAAIACPWPSCACCPEAKPKLFCSSIMRFLDIPGKEPTGMDDTMIRLLGDIRPGMLPEVEIPGSAFHLAAANGVRVPTVAAMTVAGAQDPLPLLLGPFAEGAPDTEVVRPRNLQLLPSKYAPLLLQNDGLSPCRAFHALHEAIALHGELEACRDVLVWLRAASTARGGGGGARRQARQWYCTSSRHSIYPTWYMSLSCPRSKGTYQPCGPQVLALTLH